MTRRPVVISLIAFIIHGCGPAPQAEDTTPAPDPAALAAENVAGAEKPVVLDAAPDRLPATMPAALLGSWRERLDRPLVAADCDIGAGREMNMGKVLDIRETGYSIFENGGRLITVHERSDRRIEATFDTTYADTPTSARSILALAPDGTLAMRSQESGGAVTDTTYARCPE